MTTKLTDRLGELSKDKASFLTSLEKLSKDCGLKPYFKDWLIEKMRDEGLPVVEAAELWLGGYTGSNSFALDVKSKLDGGRRLTPRQARAIINVAFKEGLGLSSAQDGNSPSSAATLAPPAPPTPRYDCYKCDKKFHTYPELMTHKEQAHPYVHKCRLCDFESTDRNLFDEHRKEHYAPLFEKVPQSGLDLTLIPEGRYAVPDLDPTAKDYLFLTVRRVPRGHNRSRKYRFGFVSYGNERVAEGTLEVRLWHGDAKELVGEQRPGETYRGDFTDEFKLIMKDPTASSKLFGKLISCCGKCGKSLTDPTSRNQGIGPECIKKFRSLPGNVGLNSTSAESLETKEQLAEKMRNIGRASGTLPTWAARRPSAGQAPPVHSHR
jgi:hypothetical protein